MNALTSGFVPDYKNQIDEMQKLMSCEVEALAAGDKEFAGYLQTIEVRGRKMVVIKKHSQQRSLSVILASLFAAENPAIDSVLYQAGVKANFISDSGEVSLEAFIPDPVKDTPIKVENVSQAKRNIILEEDESISPGKWVAIYVDTGVLFHVGVVNDDDTVLTINGSVIQPNISLTRKPLSGFPEAAKLAAQIYVRNNP